MTLDDTITSETASSLMESLRLSNDRYAMRLAVRSAWRFIFRYVYLKDQFGQYKAGKQSLTDLDCFIGLLTERISDSANEVLALSRARFKRYMDLVAFFEKGLPKKRRLARIAEVEAVALKRMIEFELKRNKHPDWSLGEGGLAQITDDFALLTEYVNTSENRSFREHCDRWKEFFLSPKEKKEIAKLPSKDRQAKVVEKLRPVIQPVWLYFVALCHVLQERDNVLTGLDAYWLGLVDEVIGLDELTFRLIMETVPRRPRRA